MFQGGDWPRSTSAVHPVQPHKGAAQFAEIILSKKLGIQNKSARVAEIAYNIQTQQFVGTRRIFDSTFGSQNGFGGLVDCKQFRCEK